VTGNAAFTRGWVAGAIGLALATSGWVDFAASGAPPVVAVELRDITGEVSGLRVAGDAWGARVEGATISAPPVTGQTWEG